MAYKNKGEASKKVIIIGGGVAGLTAGIYLQQAGFETVIYEKNAYIGGQCTGWKREGFFIDNCIHWLTGTREDSDLNKLWKNVGALGEGVDLIRQESFYIAERNGEKLVFWRDLERTRKEMLELSPVDAEEINKFIDYTKLGESLDMPVQKPFDMMNPIELIKMGASMSNIVKLIKEYGKMDIGDLADKFQHPLIRDALIGYMPKDYQAYSIMVSYASITGGNGEIPKGGSLAMVMRMKDKYEKRGGTIHIRSSVKKVCVEGKLAKGIELEDGRSVSSDYVICACDMDYTFSHLLSTNYMPKDLVRIYREREKYPVISGFQVAFAVDEIFDELAGTHLFWCPEFQVAERKVDRMSLKSYSYDDSFAPEGKCVLQSNLTQTEEDFTFWNKLYPNKEKYQEEKARVAEEMVSRAVEQYPFLKDKLHILDIWTPATYHRYCNAYRGSYMSFIITKNAKNQNTSGVIKGLRNVLLASQWLRGPGGLPTAAAMGKFAAQHIMKKEKMSIL